MSAARLAQLALDDALTQALIGEEVLSTAIAAGALAAIAKHGASIPDAVAFGVLAQGQRVPK